MRVPCVGALITDGERLLLVQRAHPPGEGLWTVPGGRVEAGETEEVAVRREVYEETGLHVDVGRLAGRVERGGPAGATYAIGDYACTVTGGELRPGDDASAARWVPYGELDGYELTELLHETLREWGVVP